MSGDLGARIDAAWKRAGFKSRKDMFRASGLSDYNQLAQWAKGKAVPHLPSLMQVATTCGVSLHWLAFGELQPDPALLARWLDGPGAEATREARVFLASLPLGGLVPDERFYSIAWEAWKTGKGADDAVARAIGDRLR